MKKNSKLKRWQISNAGSLSSIMLIIGCAFIASCEKEQLRLEFECDGKEIGIIVGLELIQNPRPEFGQGAAMRVGLDVTDKRALDDCCEKRTWRSWTKPSETYRKAGIQVRAGQWNEDFNPDNGSSNLPSRGRDGSPLELPFDAIFRDFPAATNDEITVEFITCYGCVDAVDGIAFKPLSCFTWSYEKDGDDVDVDGFDPISVSDVNAMNLPRARYRQDIPSEPF